VRILHIDTGEELRGGQRQVLLLLEALNEAGHESLLLAQKNSPLEGLARLAGFSVSPSSSKELWLLSREVELVHAHDARAHTMAAIASRRKFVVSRRVVFPVKRSLASSWKYQRASRFLAVSEFVARELKAAGVRAEKIDIVYDAVDVNAPVVPWSAQSPAVALASWDPQKGRELVQQAAALAQIPVVFSENLTADLRHASMFVYITRSEGLGSAVLLAMSLGVPVIASAVGGLTEVFEHGISGIFVGNDPEEIAAAMRRVLSEPALTHGLIEHGIARIAQRFTKQHMLDATLESYRRALAS
jgi:glycosyltransferase involved in cell wall biosynthesis